MHNRHVQKIIFCFIFFAGLSGNAYTQNNPTQGIDSTRIWQGLYINPIAGIEKALPSGSSGSITLATSFDLGAEVCYWFHPNFGFSAGAQFQQYSFNFTYSGVLSQSDYGNLKSTPSSAQDTTLVGGYTTSVRYVFDYIRIPVLLHFISSHTDKIGFYCEAGASADVLLAGSVSGNISQTRYTFTKAAFGQTYNYLSTTSTAVNAAETNPNAARINIGLHVGIGAMFPVSKRFSLVIAAAADFRVLNSGNGANDFVEFGNSKYYFFGTGNYGNFNFQSLIAKLQYKL